MVTPENHDEESKVAAFVRKLVIVSFLIGGVASAIEIFDRIAGAL